MAFLKFKPIASYFNFYSQIPNSELSGSDVSCLLNDEEIKYVFKSTRDLVILTNKRIILIDKKGIRAFRKTVVSLNYSSISSINMSIRNLDTTFEFILNSSHSMILNFYKPIPLNVMNEIYKHIVNLTLKK